MAIVRSKIKIKQLAISYWLFAVIICGLLTVDCGLTFAQDKDDHLTVKENIKADYITFTGDRADFPTAPLEGELFYNSTQKLPKYFNGTQWQGFGGGGVKTVGSKIVGVKRNPPNPALDSLDATKADYVCDGIDDQVEIQAAIDALGTIGGAVYILEGTYNISGLINMKSTISLIGAGAGTVLRIVSGASSVNVINASNVSGTLILQLKIDGNSKTGSNNKGIYFNNVTYSKIDKVWVENMSTYGIYFEGNSQRNIISNSYIQNNAWDGIYFTGSLVSFNTISGNNINSNSNGIYFYNRPRYNIVHGNIINSNVSTYGIWLYIADGNVISYNNIQANSQGGIYSWGSSSNTVSDNNIQANGRDGVYFAGDSGSPGNNNTISSNNILLNGENGINLQSYNTNNIISSNIIYDNGGTGSFDGIYFGVVDSNNLISSNRIFDSSGTGYGINIDYINNTNNYLSGNLIDGAGYAGRLIQDLGTNTKYTDKTKMTLEKKQINISTATYTLDVATNPQSYVYLVPSVDTTLSLASGKSAGDLLLIENGTTTNKNITIDEGTTVKLVPKNLPLTLGVNDSLELIWNGSLWLEITRMDNQN